MHNEGASLLAQERCESVPVVPCTHRVSLLPPHLLHVISFHCRNSILPLPANSNTGPNQPTVDQPALQPLIEQPLNQQALHEQASALQLRGIPVKLLHSMARISIASSTLGLSRLAN